MPARSRIIGASYRDFRWETPEYFNFAEVIDKFAEDPRRVAILWEDRRDSARG